MKKRVKLNDEGGYGMFSDELFHRNVKLHDGRRTVSFYLDSKTDRKCLVKGLKQLVKQVGKVKE